MYITLPKNSFGSQTLRKREKIYLESRKKKSSLEYIISNMLCILCGKFWIPQFGYERPCLSEMLIQSSYWSQKLIQTTTFVSQNHHWIRSLQNNLLKSSLVLSGKPAWRVTRRNSPRNFTEKYLWFNYSSQEATYLRVLPSLTLPQESVFGVRAVVSSVCFIGQEDNRASSVLWRIICITHNSENHMYKPEEWTHRSHLLLTSLLAEIQISHAV